MYVVLDKKTKKIIHTNPARTSEGLTPKEVYDKFDSKTMDIGKIDGPLPAEFDLDKDGNIISRTGEKTAKTEVFAAQSLSDRVKLGRVRIGATQKVVLSGNTEKIVEKTLEEQAKEGLIELLPTQKIVKIKGIEQIVEKSLREQVDEKIIELAPNQKIENNKIVLLNDREMYDARRISLDEYKDAKIEYFSKLAFEKREKILPDYKIQNAALGLYDPEKSEVIKSTVLACKNEFNRIKERIKSANSADEVDKVREAFPEHLISGEKVSEKTPEEKTDKDVKTVKTQSPEEPVAETVSKKSVKKIPNSKASKTKKTVKRTSNAKKKES